MSAKGCQDIAFAEKREVRKMLRELAAYGIVISNATVGEVYEEAFGTLNPK